jgi:hypothetical protein
VDWILGLAYLAQLDNPAFHQRDRHEIPTPATAATAAAFEVRLTGDTTTVADPTMIHDASGFR